MSNKNLDYQSALEEIEQIVALIEQGEMSIDELTSKVKRATTLIKSCQKKLRKTEQSIDEILDELEN